MPQITSIDYAEKRIYLSADTMTQGVDPVQVYKEVRSRRATNESDRKFKPIILAQGNEPKGGGSFTPRRAVLLDGARLVPYDADHTLKILIEVITDDEQSGAGAFDRSLLSPGVAVNIDRDYRQVEVVTVPSGGVLLNEQAQQLSELHATLEAPGVFSQSALTNTPSQAIVEAPKRFDINLIARSEEGVNIPTQISYREMVFCPDANSGAGAVYIGQRNNSPLSIVSEE